MKNRSVPVDTLLPHVFYPDVAAAIVWLTKVFGFTEHYRYAAGDGIIQGAQLHLGEAWIMIAITRAGRSSPLGLGERTQSLTVFVAHVDAHFERTKAAGATIIEDLHETIYGEAAVCSRGSRGPSLDLLEARPGCEPGQLGSYVSNIVETDPRYGRAWTN